MTNVIPIPIFPHERLADVELMEVLKDSFIALGAPFQVTPVPAVPGSPGRILAWGTVAPWCQDQVVIRAENVRAAASIAAALGALLTAPEGDPRVFTQAQWLGAMLGSPVRYVGTEEVAP